MEQVWERTPDTRLPDIGQERVLLILRKPVYGTRRGAGGIAASTIGKLIRQSG